MRFPPLALSSDYLLASGTSQSNNGQKKIYTQIDNKKIQHISSFLTAAPSGTYPPPPPKKKKKKNPTSVWWLGGFMLSLGIFRDMSHSHKSVFCGSDCSYLGPYLTAIYTFAARACVDIGWGSLLPSTSTASHLGPLARLASVWNQRFFPFPGTTPSTDGLLEELSPSLSLSLSLSQSLVLAAFLVWWLQCKKRSPPSTHPTFQDFSFCCVSISFRIASISLSVPLSLSLSLSL